MEEFLRKGELNERFFVSVIWIFFYQFRFFVFVLLPYRPASIARISFYSRVDYLDKFRVL